jgi:hypothetical protein
LGERLAQAADRIEEQTVRSVGEFAGDPSLVDSSPVAG